MVSLDAITSAANTFKTTFHSFQADFFGYGQAIFFILLTISIVLKALEYAWTKELTEALPDWIRDLIGAGFFWTVMQNLSWLSSLPNTASVIGSKYLSALDPSSIILKGVVIINTIMKPLADAGLLDTGVAAMFIGVACCSVIMFCMISIAVNIAVTAICIQGLISISPLFLAAGAFKQSAPVARNAIDAVIGNAVKLMGFYLVVYAGNTALDAMSSHIDGTFNPTTSSFDQYSYIISVVALYYAVAKTFPSQISKLVMGVIHGNREVNAMAAANAALNATTKAVETSSIRGITASNTGNFNGAGRHSSITDSAITSTSMTMADTVANYREIRSVNTGNAQEGQLGTKGTVETSSKFEAGNVTGRFKGLANKSGVDGSSYTSHTEYIERVNGSGTYREIASGGSINSQAISSDVKGSIGTSAPHPGLAGGTQPSSRVAEGATVSGSPREITSSGSVNSQAVHSAAKGSIMTSAPHPGLTGGAQSGSHVTDGAKASGSPREITSSESSNSQAVHSDAKGSIGTSAPHPGLAGGAQSGSHVAEAAKTSESHRDITSVGPSNSQAAQSDAKGSIVDSVHHYSAGNLTDRFMKLAKKNAGRNKDLSIIKDMNKLKNSVQAQVKGEHPATDVEQPENKST